MENGGCTQEHCFYLDSDLDKTVLTMAGGNVVQSLGMEVYFGDGRVRNTEGSTIPNCKAVWFTDSTGAVPEVQITGTDEGYRIAQAIVGVTTEEIANNQLGYVTSYGIVRDCDTSAFNDGDSLFLSTNGTFTNIPPSGNGTIFVGTVNRAHATDGEVNVDLRIVYGIADVLYSNNNANGLQLKNISNGTDTADAVNLGQLQSVNNSISSAIQNNTEDGYIYKGNFETSQNNYGWSIHDDGSNIHMEFPTLGGSNYFGIETSGAFMQLYANPNPSNDYKMWTITETQGADTEINIYEGGTGHNRFWSSGSVRVGGGASSTCDNLTSDVDCNTPSTGADLVVQDDIWFGGNIIGNGSQLTDLPSPDLSAYVPYTGASSNVDLGSKTFTTTGLGTFGNLDIDTLNLNGNVITDSTGTISFGNEDLETTGVLKVGGSSSQIGVIDIEQTGSSTSPLTSEAAGFSLIPTGSNPKYRYYYAYAPGSVQQNGNMERQANGFYEQDDTSKGSAAIFQSFYNSNPFVGFLTHQPSASQFIPGYSVIIQDHSTRGKQIKMRDTVWIEFDDTKVVFGAGDDSEQYWDGTNMIYNNAGGGLHIFDGGNISVDGIIYNSIIDNDINALEWFEVADGTINDLGHNYFKNCAVNQTITDYSRPEKELYCDKEMIVNGTEYCYERTIYPHTKVKGGYSAECVSAKTTQALALINKNMNVYENLTDFDTSLMVENLYTQSKVINASENYAMKFINVSYLDDKYTHKNKEIITVEGGEQFVLNVEERIVDLEGAFSDHMTCMYLHDKYEDYRLCMLDTNPKEKIK